MAGMTTPRFQVVRGGMTTYYVIDTLTGNSVPGAVYVMAAGARGHADGMNLTAPLPPPPPPPVPINVDRLAELLEETDDDDWRSRSYAEQAQFIATVLDGCSTL